MTQSVLVLGAGIAGASLAYWLSRSGRSVTLVEKSSGVRSSGSPVDVRGDAARVTRAMGLESRLAAADTGVVRAAFVDGHGRTRGVVRTRRTSDGDGPRDVEIARADLAEALLDAARADARIVLGDSIAGLRQDPSGVDVTFEYGRPARFDLVLGADGLHSTVRRLAFGPEQNYARPFGLYIGTLRTKLHIADPAQALLYNEPNRLLAIHPAGGDPGAAFIFRWQGAYDNDLETGRRLVETAYEGVGWLAPQLLKIWHTANDVYFDAVTRIDLPKWATGRIALVGDAASCLSLLGEGSSNAIVAGKTLADALDTHPGDHAAAFASYERIHRTRIRRNSRGAAISAHFLVPATRIGINLRNRALSAAAAVHRR
ncbi:FAD-dependent oxidoreductase [Leifsonia sp. McL0607]|uniref:FAD-dependent oxidoreductase n=1 Tax=Leifsonia sp. McL0607 TaxID=3415672 RepID=UPI003CEB01A1